MNIQELQDKIKESLKEGNYKVVDIGLRNKKKEEGKKD